MRTSSDPADIVCLPADDEGCGSEFPSSAVATHGGVVLTERTDALGRGRFEQRFWVYGRFELADGRIKVWRGSFDWLDMIVSLVCAGAGAHVPALNRPWPGD
jgi:limonene-1,2-epoxide hydrolase